MPPDPPPLGFNRIAPLYQFMEATLAGPIMNRARLAFSDHWPAAGHALLVGEGTGHLLAALRRARPALEITCLDASPRMLRLARRRLEKHGLPLDRVTFLHADILRAPLASYEMIATQFFLDCFGPSDLRALVARLAASARPGARWFLADFQIPDHGLRRARARFILALLYRFFRAVAGISARRLEPALPLLQSHGFAEIACQTSDLGFISSAVLARPSRPAA